MGGIIRPAAENSRSASAVWQRTAGSGSISESLRLPRFEGPAAPVLTAPGGYLADIPKGRLKDEIAKLAAQPGYGYLKQLQTAKNTDWNRIQLEYGRWDYKQEGLTGAGAAVIALAAAAVTGGAGAAVIGAAQGTAAAAAANAAFTSLVAQASVAAVNNKGNPGRTLRELGRSRTAKNMAVAAVSAGVAEKTGTSAVLNGAGQSPWVKNLTANLAEAGSAALAETAVNGGSLKNNLEAGVLAALVQTGHGEVSGKIKQLDQHYIAHKIAHAVAGCAAASAGKGKCADGAVGAAVGEVVGELLVKNTDFSGMTRQEIEREKKKIADYAKLAAGTVAGMSGGNVDAAANAAQTAVVNNAFRFVEALAGGQKGMASLADAASLYETQMKNGKTPVEAQQAVESYLQGYGMKNHTGAEMLVYGSIAIPAVAVGGGVYAKAAGLSIAEGVVLNAIKKDDYNTSNLIYDASLGVLMDKKRGMMIRWSNSQNKWAVGYLNAKGKLQNEFLSSGSTPVINKALGKYDKTIFKSSEWMNGLKND